MAEARLLCTGAEVGGFRIPPFQLRGGNLVCLHLPRAAPDKLDADLLRILPGLRPAAGIRLLAKVLPVAPARDGRPRLLRLLRPLRATDWLQRRTNISNQEAKAALHQVGLDMDQPLTHLAGTPATLLGLEAVRMAGAEAIVYTTAGLDPAGVQAVHAAVAAGLAVRPAIHLSRPHLTNGREQRDCFPGARCIEIAPSAAPSMAAESAQRGYNRLRPRASE